MLLVNGRETFGCVQEPPEEDTAICNTASEVQVHASDSSLSERQAELCWRGVSRVRLKDPEGMVGLGTEYGEVVTSGVGALGSLAHY